MITADTASLVPNATFFAELVLFGGVVGIIARFVVPPVRAAVRRRQIEIEQTRGAARADAAAAREVLARARAEADGILDDARREGHRIRTVSREVADALVAEAGSRSGTHRPSGRREHAPATAWEPVTGWQIPGPGEDAGRADTIACAGPVPDR